MVTARISWQQAFVNTETCSSIVHLENWVEEGRALYRQKLGVEGLEENWLLGGKTWQSINNSISFALTIIASNVVLPELLGLVKRARKTYRVLREVRVLCWWKTAILVNIPLNQWLLQFFQIFETFWAFWQIFDFLIVWLLIPVCSGNLKAKPKENAKSAYLTGIFVGASSVIKPAIRDWR